MPPTTTFTSTSPNQMRRRDESGSRRSTRLSRSIHAQLSHHISGLKTMTIPGSSKRPSNISATSTAWRKLRQPLRSFMTRCWNSIRAGSILGGRSGVRPAPSSDELIGISCKWRPSNQRTKRVSWKLLIVIASPNTARTQSLKRESLRLIEQTTREAETANPGPRRVKVNEDAFRKVLAQAVRARNRNHFVVNNMKGLLRSLEAIFSDAQGFDP